MHPIFVELCLTLSKHGFKFLRTYDLGEVEGSCQECGHPIRYEQWFEDLETGEEFVIGSECMFKVYVFSHWRDQIEEKDIENRHLQRAGKWLWIIHRDHYLERIEEEIPQPKDYDKDFKELADDIKRLVFKVRSQIRQEEKEEQRKKLLLERKRTQIMKYKEFFAENNIDYESLNEKERQFVKDIYNLKRKGYTLTQKQGAWFDAIRSGNYNNHKQESNDNSTVNELITKLIKIRDEGLCELNGWELEFIESVANQVSEGRILSERQIECIKKIIGKLVEVSNVSNSYEGRETLPWIVNQIAGIWIQGVVKNIRRETPKAVLCDLVVVNGTEKVFEEVWVPKSQFKEIITL